MATKIATEFPQFNLFDVMNWTWRKKELVMGMLSARNQYEHDMMEARRESEMENADGHDYNLPSGQHPGQQGAKPAAARTGGSSAEGGGDWSTPHPNLRQYENVRAGEYSK